MCENMMINFLSWGIYLISKDVVNMYMTNETNLVLGTKNVNIAFRFRFITITLRFK